MRLPDPQIYVTGSVEMNTNNSSNSENATQKGTNALSEIQQKAFNEIALCLSEAVSQDITVDTLIIDLDISSIVFIKTLIALENAFEFEFDDEMLSFSSYTTIWSMIEYVESKVKG